MAAFIRKKLPEACIVKTLKNKGGSKHGTYYVEETSVVLKLLAQYNKYKAADKARIEKEKHAQIDTVVEKYAKKIGRLPKFLCYRAKIDYGKDVADIENELILMAGEAMMDTSKQNISYTPSVCPVSGVSSDKLTHNDRYGNLFDKFIND